MSKEFSIPIEATSLQEETLFAELTQASLLASELTTKETALAALEAERDAALHAVGEQYSDRLRPLKDEKKKAEGFASEEWTALLNATREGVASRTISNTAAVYMDALLQFRQRGIGRSSKVFEFEEAQAVAEEYRRLQPGTRVLVEAHWGFHSEPDRISQVQLLGGGLVADEPSVKLRDNTYNFESVGLVLDIPLTNGRQINIPYTRSMPSMIVIDGEAIDKLTSIWVNEHHIGKRRIEGLYAQDLRKCITELAVLLSLQPELSEEVVEIRDWTLEAFEKVTQGDASDVVLDALPHIRIINPTAYEDKVERLVSNSRLFLEQKQGQKFEETIAIAQNPNWENLSSEQRAIARGEAAVHIAQLRLAAVTVKGED